MLLGQIDRQLGVVTPKLAGAMTGTPRSKAPKARKLSLLTQNLLVAHQRVNIDVDFCSKQLRGYTELTIVPSSSSLRCIKLDAREMKIKRVLVNGTELAEYVYNDQLYISDPALIEELGVRRVPNVRDVCSEEFGVAQHHFLRRKLSYLFGQIEDDQLCSAEKPDNLNSEELLILLPENLKIQPSDPSNFHTPTSLVPTNVTPLFRSKLTGDTYSPIQIAIEYEVVNPKTGVHFICPELDESSLWHVYTSNSDYNVSTSSWVPSVDNLLERTIWSIELSIPRSVRDIETLRSKLRKSTTSKSEKSVPNSDFSKQTNNKRKESLLEGAVIQETDRENDINGLIEDSDQMDIVDNSSKHNTDEEFNEDENKIDFNNSNSEMEIDKDDEKEEKDEKNVKNVPQQQVKDDEEQENEHEDEEEGDSLDLFVCTGDSSNTKESAHPSDLTKKIVSWSIFNPVAAHHIGWSVGAFQTIELSNFVDSNASGAVEEDDVFDDFEDLGKDESSPSVHLYYLPGQEDLAKNTCIFSSQALEFFLKEYGSYPFSSYGIVFVYGPRYPFNNFAGLSILNADILYPADVIEPMFEVTEDILECIACQWSGINIVPQSFNDIWCTIGISKFMSFQFLRTLMGTNEYRYRIKKKMDAIVAEDVGQRPIGLLSLQAPVGEESFKFVRLKAPIILSILDRRMTKTDKSFGFSRVLPKLFLQAMSGDLQSGALSTQHFQYVCEKVYRNRLESFFKQWVYGIGTPIFTITQKFNKKRSMIEVMIRQTQLQQHKALHPKPETFINDAVSYLNGDLSFPIQQTFLGPLTIRVHEADGTPYEHIVDIKNSVVKFDVQYNTKFKRLKKSREEAEGLIFLRLGDILEYPEDIKEWKFEEWPKRDEELLEPFEWIRVDTDLEWVATFNVKQPDYMFGAQLQQDRDIEAQIAAINYFGQQEKPNAIYCTMLTRTLVDSRYFYGVRIAAAQALARFSHSANNFIGLPYLLKAFQLLFCFADSYVPMSNSFEDFGKFFLQRAVPLFLADIKDDSGRTPRKIQTLLFNLLRYNDNSNNAFLDCFYVSDLVQALVKSVIVSLDELDSQDASEFLLQSADVDERGFISEVVEELSRLRKLDRWVPSYHTEVSYSCLEQKITLARADLIKMSFEELLYLTSTKYNLKIRTLAFKGLFLLGGLRNAQVLRYFLDVCLLEQSTPEFRAGLILVLVNAVAVVAISGCPSNLDDPEFETTKKNPKITSSIPGSTIIVEESLESDLSTKRDTLAKATIRGTIEVLRRDLAHGKGLRYILWQLLHSSLLSLSERKAVFLLCDILYVPEDSLVVRLPIPCVPFEELKKKIVAKDLRDGKILIKREARFRIQLSTKIILNDKSKLRRTDSTDQPTHAPKIKLRLHGTSSLNPPRIEDVSVEEVSRQTIEGHTEMAAEIVETKPKKVSQTVPEKYVPTFNTKSETKSEKKHETETKSETKPDSNLESRLEPKPDSKSESKAESRPETKSESKLETKTGIENSQAKKTEFVQRKGVESVPLNGIGIVAKKELSNVTVLPQEVGSVASHQRLVSRDPSSMMVKFKLPKERLVRVKRRGAAIIRKDTKLTLRFTNEKNLSELKRLKEPFAIKRYVRINTRTKTVELSSRPFEKRV